MLVPSAIVLDESIYTAVPTLLACGRKSSGKATVLIAFPVGTAALCQKVIITTLLIRTAWPLVMPYADRSSSPQAILVLRTVKQAGRLGLLLVKWKYPNITRRGF